jgi:spore coat protein CotH
MRAVLVMTAAMSLALVTSTVASGQTQDALFDDSALQEIRLIVNSRDWQTLKADANENTYYPADLVWQGLTVRNVGIRSRGNGTRNGIKPGLRVDFNRYVSNQDFLGLKALVLDNTYSDGSTIRESVTMKMFQRVGVPSPREAHAKLYVNNEYVGAYVVVEEVDRTFISRVFGAAEGDVETGGYLFEFKWRFYYYFEYLGSGLQPYAALFEPQTHETDSLSALYTPIEELIRAINESSDQDFRSVVGGYLDLPLLMKHLAVESFMVEWDGIAGNWAANNFYLYRFRDSKRAQLIPWDKDNTFTFIDVPVTFRLDWNVLTRRALQVPELKQVFDDALAQCAAIAQAPGSDDPRGWLEREVEREAAQVAPAVAGDPVFPVPYDEFQSQVDFLLRFARLRSPFVTCELTAPDPQSCSIPTDQSLAYRAIH